MSDDSEQTQRLMREVGAKAADILRKSGRTVNQDPTTGEWSVAPLKKQPSDWLSQYNVIDVTSSFPTSKKSFPGKQAEPTEAVKKSNRGTSSSKSGEERENAETGKLSGRTKAAKAIRAGRDSKKSSEPSRFIVLRRHGRVIVLNKDGKVLGRRSPKDNARLAEEATKDRLK